MKLVDVILVIEFLFLCVYLGVKIFCFIKFLKIKQIEKFISKYKELLITQKVFNSLEDIESFFTRGSCYLFARIIKEQFPEVKFMINNSLRHCKVSYFNYTFDIRGSEKIKYDRDFREADAKDIEYMKEYFGFRSYPNNLSKEEFEESFKNDTLTSYNSEQECTWKNIEFTAN